MKNLFYILPLVSVHPGGETAEVCTTPPEKVNSRIYKPAILSHWFYIIILTSLTKQILKLIINWRFL